MRLKYYVVYVVLIFTLIIVIEWTDADKSSRSKGSINSKPSKDDDDHDDNRKNKKRQKIKVKKQHSIRSTILPTKKEKTSDKLLRTISDVNSNLISSVKNTINITSRMKRNIKSYFSSDYEVLLLQLTNPSDDKPLYYDLNRFLATTKTFVRNIDMNNKSNPYRVTLHKIWCKILENDIRIVCKALFLLHSLLKCSDIPDAIIYQSLINQMSTETVKTSNCKYFDFSKINYNTNNNDDNDNNSSQLIHKKKYYSFIRIYSRYLRNRSKMYVKDFKEMKEDINYGISSDEIVRKVCMQ
jgi:hypothetical protein